MIEFAQRYKYGKNKRYGKDLKGYFIYREKPKTKEGKREWRERMKSHLWERISISIVILLLSLGTYWRNSIWKTDIALWTDCVEKSPHKARPHANLGFAYLNEGAYDKALDMTQKAIQIDPKYANAYYNLGMIYQKKGDVNKAISMVKKSIDLDPDLDMAYYSLGGIYFENGQYEEAAEAFKKFITIYPHYPNAHHLLAITYAAQKQFDKAVTEFQSEIRINPNHTLAHLNLGQIYWYEFKNRERAIYHLRVALRLDPFLPHRTEIQRLVRLLGGSP